MQVTKIRVSDIITDNKIREWKNGDVVTISAGCGAGKSYFIKNVLYEQAKNENKKILMLIHRTKCVEQFKMEIEADNKTDTIDIQTYQSIEFALKNGKEFDFSCYAYIVSDEFHYFIEDSAFNSYTDLSFNTIINCVSAIKIFMSATGATMLEMMKKTISKKIKIHPYSIEEEYSHLKNLRFFYQKDTIESLAHIFKKSGKKAIFFIQSVEEAHSLYKKYEDCSLFLCGKHSETGKKYYSNVDEEKIKKMLINERFDELFLITTCCFDAGANIIDTELHNVVIDVKNVSSLIQCLGRKRSQGANDKLDVYIKAVTNQQLGGMRSKRVDGIKRADYLLEHDTRQYVEKYNRNDDDFNKFHKSLIYDEPMSKKNRNTCTKKVNMLIYEKYKIDIMICDEMMKKGYAQYIARILKFGNPYDRHYGFCDEDKLNDYLYRYSFEETIMYTTTDKKNLIDKMNVKHNGKLLKSIKSLNAVLEEKKYKYRIKEVDIYRDKKRYRHAWQVISI